MEILILVYFFNAKKKTLAMEYSINTCKEKRQLQDQGHGTESYCTDKLTVFSGLFIPGRVKRSGQPM